MIPKVSICIPAYKRPELMKVCLESISKQNFTDYDVVITDDTPDNSVGEIVNSFKNKIKNLKYYKNEIIKGSPENWNECVKKAKGEYIKIIHCDDSLADENSLFEYVKILDKNPRVNFAFSSSKVCDKNGKIIYTYKPNQQKVDNLSKDIGSLFGGNFIGPPSATIYRKTNIKYDKNLKWLVDEDFYMMLLRENHNFVFVETPLIIVSSEGDDKMTDECKNDKCIEFRENLYVYNKTRENGTRVRISDYFNIFLNLIQKYNIRKLDDLKICVPFDKTMLSINILIRINNNLILINKFKKYLTKKYEEFAKI